MAARFYAPLNEVTAPRVLVADFTIERRAPKLGVNLSGNPF